MQHGHGVSFAAALRVWARIAALSFGGPAGQIAVMHRILVEEKRWISEQRFLHALNYCMLLPGPEAQQLATYIGWLMHGVKGGVAAGALFILPGVVAIMALSIVYALYGSLGWVAGLFFGLKAAVLAIVVEAVVRVGKRALKTRAAVALAAVAFAALFFFAAPFPLVVIGAGVIGYAASAAGSQAFTPSAHGPDAAKETGASLLDDHDMSGDASRRRGAFRAAVLFLVLWLAPVAALLIALGPAHVFSQIAIFFSKMAVVTFGGAYAVLAYVSQQAVETYGWLRPGEMLDGLGLAETTPGPLIMVLQFVAFLGAFRAGLDAPPLLAGALGGLLATWVTFTPCFLWIFAGAPFVERLRGDRALAGALSAITAAVVGVILNLAVWFAAHTLFGQVAERRYGPLRVDIPDPASAQWAAIALAAAAAVAIFRFKAGMLTVLAACSLAGLAFSLLA